MTLQPALWWIRCAYIQTIQPSPQSHIIHNIGRVHEALAIRHVCSKRTQSHPGAHEGGCRREGPTLSGYRAEGFTPRQHGKPWLQIIFIHPQWKSQLASIVAGS